ncbi:hypothetical protein BT96DRAFT_934626 [Gymnopus androsaceus JB14]|uniref:Uncharacterized protein n=1 Tax=Gymnopus androsaceus JB14 TaxID=1447944 RepID=A0A6A4I995_9AGAR|nr:hypothetical protein BT96DRAFT_934626 [Gymnopus androsaceus JB14]
MTPEEQELIFFSAQGAFFGIVTSIVTITGYGAFALGTGVAGPFANIEILGTTTNHPTNLLDHNLCLLHLGCLLHWQPSSHIQYTFMRTLEGGIAAQIEASNQKTLVWEYMPGWPTTINLLLSDCIVVWRAWILFQDDKLWKLLLAVLMFANIAINIADCIWDNIEVTIEVSSSTILDWLSGLISLAVNIHCDSVDCVESMSVYVVFILLDTYTAVDLGFSQAMEIITAMSIVVAEAQLSLKLTIIMKPKLAVAVEKHHDHVALAENLSIGQVRQVLGLEIVHKFRKELEIVGY